MAVISTNQNLGAVSYTVGEVLTIDSGAVLTIDAQVPADVSALATLPGTISCITSGKFRIVNNSTTDPLVLTLSSNTQDLRFEKSGIFEARGAMIELGTGNGASGQSFSLAAPPLDVIPFPSYVEVEDGVGAGTYTPWMVAPVAGYTVNWSASEFSSLDCGNVFFWNGTTRTLSVGDGTNGNVLTSGLKVRIPNIYVHSNVNNTTPALRSLVDLSPSGTADLECLAFSNAIYWVNTAFGRVRCVRVGFAGEFRCTSANGGVELRGVSVCPDTQQTTVAQLFQVQIILGTSLIDRVTALTGGLVSGAGKIVLAQLFALTSDDDTPKVTNCLFARRAGRASGNDASAGFTNLPAGTVYENIACIGGRVGFTNQTSQTVINMRHADDLGTAQLTTFAANAILPSNCADLRFVNFGNAGVAACRNQIVSADSQSSNIEFFGGEYDGGGNTGGAAAGNGSGLSFYNFTLRNQRASTNFSDSPATFLSSGSNILNCRATSSGSVANEACQASTFDLTPGDASSFSTLFSGASAFAFANLIDAGLTPTTGAVVLGPFGNYDAMTFTGGAQLDQAGGVELPSTGDSIEVESLFAMHAITSFQNTDPVWTYTEVATLNTNVTTAPGLTAEFRLRNPGGTYGAYQSLTGANLSGAIAALSGYSSDVGVYMQVRLTATSNDATRVLNKVYMPTNVDNTYVAPDATVTLAGPNPTDETSMYLLSDDTLLETFTGAGTFSFSAAANFLEQVYFIRRDSGGFEIMRTRSAPQALLLGDNGTVALFAGAEVQLAEAPILSALDALIRERLDVVISTRADQPTADRAASNAALAAALSA